jgi:hypothetical protein
MAKLKETNEELEEIRIQSAKEKISGGYDLVKQRQKLIKLAHSSVAGWRAVDEYIKNSIASDSEVEKRITKAHTRAEGKKLKDERSKRQRDAMERARPYLSANKKAADSNTSTTSQAVWRSGRCHRCQKRGH